MIRSTSHLLSLATAAVLLGAPCGLAYGQDALDLRERFLINTPDLGGAIAPGGFFRGAPGTNSGTPFAFGPNWGDFFIGAGYQNETRGLRQRDGTLSANGNNDGTVSAGFGLGSSSDYVGMEVAITSLSTVRSGFGNRTAFSFKLHRALGASAAIAAGVEDAFIAGGQKSDGTASWYGVASKVFAFTSDDDTPNGMAVVISAGVGNGRFRTLDDIFAGQKTVNGFGSVAFLLNSHISALADYTGQDFNAGLSIVPLRQFPVVFTPAIADITGTASKTPRFIIGVGIGMHF